MKKQVPNSVKLIDNHLNQFFDQSDNIVVLDEIDSEIIHSDIYIIKSKKERPFTILLSCGMSALPMSVPQNTDIPKYIEIMMLLPENWKLEYKAFEDERNYWPFRILKELSKFPHENNTWLGNGHTYEHDKEFAKGVGFNSVILVNSMELSDEFTLIECEDKMVEIYTVLPLYKEELEFKKKFGKMKLLEKFDELNIEEIIQVGRKNICE